MTKIKTSISTITLANRDTATISTRCKKCHSAKVCKIKADGKGTTRIDAAKAVWVHNKKNNINISK